MRLNGKVLVIFYGATSYHYSARAAVPFLGPAASSENAPPAWRGRRRHTLAFSRGPPLRRTTKSTVTLLPVYRVLAILRYRSLKCLEHFQRIREGDTLIYESLRKQYLVEVSALGSERCDDVHAFK